MNVYLSQYPHIKCIQYNLSQYIMPLSIIQMLTHHRIHKRTKSLYLTDAKHQQHKCVCGLCFCLWLHLRCCLLNGTNVGVDSPQNRSWWWLIVFNFIFAQYARRMERKSSLMYFTCSWRLFNIILLWCMWKPYNALLVIRLQ